MGADNAGKLVQGRKHERQANVRQGNKGSFAATEHGAGRVKMAAAQEAGRGLLVAVGSSRHVEQQVKDPAKELVEDERDGLEHGRVLEVLHVEGELALLVVVLRLGDKGHVLFHVAGELVVAVVGKLPRVVRHHEARVGEEAHDVVEQRVFGKGAVAGLVAQDPEPGADEALDVAVDDPGRDPQRRVLDGGDVAHGGPAERANHEGITDQVAHGPQHRRLEAVLRDRLAQGVDVRIHWRACW